MIQFLVLSDNPVLNLNKGGDCWHYLWLHISLGEAPMKPGECYFSTLIQLLCLFTQKSCFFFEFVPIIGQLKMKFTMFPVLFITYVSPLGSTFPCPNDCQFPQQVSVR